MENAHSLEWLMYKALADRYEAHKRVHLTIPESYHSYQTIYDWTVRFHHGHVMNYGGGVGGHHHSHPQGYRSMEHTKHRTFRLFWPLPSVF